MDELSLLLKQSATELTGLIKGSKLETEVILYAPWFTSQINNFTHTEDVVLTNKILNQKIDSIKTPATLVNLEKKIIKMIANGYSLKQLPQSKLQNIVIQVYASYVSKNIYEQIQKTIKDSYTLISTIEYSTSPILISEHIKSFMVQEDNVCFVYVGGEITEVGIIEDDSITTYKTFPIGKHDFLREFNSTTKSYDYDLLYQNEMQLKTKAKQESFESLKKKWRDLLTENLFSLGSSTPNKIILISDTKTRDFFSQLINQYVHDDETRSYTRYRIINFDISYLKDIILYKTPTNTNELDLQLEALI